MSSPWSVENAKSYSCSPFPFPVQFGIDRFTPQENQWPINEDATLQLHRISSEEELDRMSSNREATISDNKCEEVKARCGKRKATKSLSAVSIVPAKIFVNEKHIAACISRLTLDNNNIEDQPDLEEEPWFDVEMMARRSKSETNVRSLLDNVNSNNNCKLVIYNELQLCLRKTSILCDLMQDEIKKPQMQLVLWKPPGGIIKNAIETLINGSNNVINKQKHFTPDEFVVETAKSLNDQMCLLESADTDDFKV